jgi:hypothetical protein
VRVLGSAPEQAWSARRIRETLETLLEAPAPKDGRIHDILLDLYTKGFIYWVTPGRYRLKSLAA